jgi:maltose O-acetyltransferase
MRADLRPGVRHIAGMFREDFERGAFHILVNVVLGSALVPRIVRSAAYRALGMEMPFMVYIRPGVTFKTVNVTLGAGAMVNRGVQFDNRARVTLGESVAVGCDVLFLTDSHEVGSPERRCSRGEILQPIFVGNGAWIGARATIMPGVTIGAGAVIAAGAVVVRDCEPNCVYAGMPAQIIRKIEDEPANEDSLS